MLFSLVDDFKSFPVPLAFYDVLARHEFYLILSQQRKQWRQRLILFLDSLADNPFQEADGHFEDAKGRRCHTKIIGKFVVCYWVDHSEKEVRIIDLLDADEFSMKDSK